MTAHALKGDRQRCLAAGMDGYIAKPIRAAELFVAIARLFPEGETAGQVAGSAPAPSPAGGVDWSEALQLAQGDAAVLRTMIEAELDEAPRLLESLRAAITARDRVQLRTVAHTLKGSVRYFGAAPVVSAAVRLEELAPAGQWSEIATLDASLQEHLALLLAALRQHVAQE